MTEHRALPEVILKNAERVLKRRHAERTDAWDFKVRPETHEERCMFVGSGEEPCSRDYDPLPDDESIPDRDLYDGTGIGAVYGFPNSAQHAWQLAGWNVL